MEKSVSVLGKRRVGDEFTESQKRLMREPIMNNATEADLQKVTGVYSPMLDDRTLRKMGNELPYKLKKFSTPGLGKTDVDLVNNPFGLDLDEPLPQEGGRKSRRNKRSNKSKTNKSKSHKKMGGKKTRRNKKGSRRNRK